MAYICDVVIALIIVTSVVLGCRRGLVKTAFKCLSLAAAVVIAYFFGSYLGSFIMSTGVYDGLVTKAENAITERFEQAEMQTLNDMKENSDKFKNSEIGKTLERLGLETDTFYEKYESSVKSGGENSTKEFALDAAETVMKCLANALGTLATFLLALIALKILSVICDGLVKLPVIRTFNKIGGFALGLVLGLCSAFLLCMALEVLMPYIPKNPVIYAGMEKDTVLYGFFVNINPFIFLLFG